MDVISYRGPGVAGGVSSGLGNAWRAQNESGTRWWFLADQTLSVLSRYDGEPEFIAYIDEGIVKGHYRYCNEFLWPILHDLPQHATYHAGDRALYRKFNVLFAQQVAFNRQRNANQFVQDYQLALIPALMPDAQCTAFWHIPWPKSVPDEYKEAMAEIARGLLSARLVGFHTDEFVSNFMDFVQENVPGYDVHVESGTIRPIGSAPSLIEVATSHIEQPYVMRPLIQQAATRYAHQTKLVAKPLGIDVAKWQEAANGSLDRVASKLPAGILDLPLVLSVDRADYTKAVFDRIKAIDMYFDANPDAVGKISFMQVCGRSRAGLAAFDHYWTKCKSLFQHVTAKHSRDDWRPLHWVEDPLTPEELAVVYKRADAMLVNPVRDGLNLTAKEFAACQIEDAGALLLSPHAGVWKEIGNYCLPASPTNHEQIVDSLHQALHMSDVEKKQRILMARIKLEKSSLARWWKYFYKATNSLSTRAANHRDAREDDRQIALG